MQRASERLGEVAVALRLRCGRVDRSLPPLDRRSTASTIPTRSSGWIQEMYWRPPATGPPTPSLKGGSILASAPPSRSSTTPVRTFATRNPCARGHVGLCLPCLACLCEEVAAGGDILVDRLVAVRAVVADRRAAHQHPRPLGLGQPPMSLHEVPRARHTAVANGLLGRGAPALRDVLAGQMHDRVATGERLDGRRLVRRVPACASSAPACRRACPRFASSSAVLPGTPPIASSRPAARLPAGIAREHRYVVAALSKRRSRRAGRSGPSLR